MSEKRRVLKAAGTVGAWTMASRVLGYVRNAIIAAFFGAGLETDAFIAAFRIPNLLRRLFGEGSLTASFVPVYTDVRTNQGEERSRELFGAAFTAVLLIVSVLTVLGIVFAHKVVAVLAPGFGDDPAKEELTVFLLRLMFPYAVAICLVALFMGVQNARGFFFAPAFAPVLLNVSIIFSAVFLAGRFDLPVTALAVGVLVGGVLQFALQWPYLKKLGHRLRLRFDFKDRDLRRVGYLMLPSLIGLSVYSLNVFLNTIFASLLVPGAVSYLFYADQLMELPQGVFAIAVGTALLPSLSGTGGAR
ncbi:MAG: murein biosynthesis integral membrane protein MurJ [Deltaproteobacteria bacterium]|nr:murein biosynthesis integral membrane protein MurJ [Deltaproteobacteria bacterium]